MSFETTNIKDREFKAFRELNDGSIVKAVQIHGTPKPFGYFALGEILKSFLDGETYNSVTSSFDSTTGIELITLFNNDDQVLILQIEYTTTGWTITSIGIEYLLKEDGDLLLLENGDQLIL